MTVDENGKVKKGWITKNAYVEIGIIWTTGYDVKYVGGEPSDQINGCEQFTNESRVNMACILINVGCILTFDNYRQLQYASFSVFIQAIICDD